MGVERVASLPQVTFWTWEAVSRWTWRCTVWRKKGRLARGLYNYPRVDVNLGVLSPTTDAEEIFTDTFETEEILANSALMKKLKQGHMQTELRKG